ncbi:putative dehalogenase hydrolase-like protein [Rhizobium phage RHph_Y65]|uniref:Putative dehalogenase hydrolase-like protein n=1 Tax=Rhizobium phage RHph_Y65 TaxID=2509785 RepID=A0A7S5R7L3_9CAUD|nr:hydrolase [Rhizobium phage RHph_Y65]QIG72568.1 putative dehalogenase hydrolase-like protein [Rhizobium phage RHph_Y65]
MTKIRHISFDVWNTLVIPNPDYARARSMYLGKVFNMVSEDAAKLYSRVKKWIDELAVQTGMGPDAESNVLMLLNMADRYADPQEILINFENLFFKYPPIIHHAVRDGLRALKHHGYTFSIASNSNFISGRTMTKFIHAEFGCMAYEVYSDLEGYAKPHLRFFEEVFHGARLQGLADYSSEILHVGDHEICDVKGANDYGFKSLLFTNPEDMSKVIKRVQQNEQPPSVLCA